MKNRLAQSSSPYLLQHANNPVDWYPWGNEALAKAKAEDKPIIVSIGYSSCHWCHVMAHESFEDDATAAIMNEHFINIKVDREERPDVDQIYMDAIQKMGLHGGWPLNVFLTPEAKPFYGGTYFPREGWKGLLQNVATAFRENRTRIEESAVQFAAAIGQSEFAQFSRHEGDFQLSNEQMNALYQNLSRRFDGEWGGIKKAPKFPMPVIWEMLDVYAYRAGNQEAANHLLFTLEKIAAGGIYDQIGGGFARYSVDGQWHVPHFEKMLYDNGQLLRRYAAAYKRTGDAKYKRVLIDTARWLQREMLHPDGGFYAALDADSEGVEGKFYVWDIEQIETLAGDDAAIIKAYYDVQAEGNWEDGHNVLRRLASDSEIAGSFGITEEQLHKIVQDFNEKALNQREQRIRPGLDNKRIAGWNGLILSGLCEAYQATGDELFLKLAKNAAAFLSSLVHQGQLARFPDQAMEGFLEDYASVIQGFVMYYQTVFDAEYLRLAQQLTDRTLEAFFDEQEGFFFFTSREAEALIARKKEVFDNVIPSSNSMMARNLFHLGTLRYDDDYVGLAREMVRKMLPLIPQEPEYLANWATLAMEMSGDFAEIVIVGPDYQRFAEEIHRRHLPMKVISAAPEPSDEPMFEMKPLQDDRTTIYVCYNRTCQLPVTSVEEALGQVRR